MHPTAITPCALGCLDRATGLPYLADPGYQTCQPCADKLYKVLEEILQRWATISRPTAAVPTRTGEGRRAPGYGSRSPAVDHVLCIRDGRTRWQEPGDPLSPLVILNGWADQVREDRHASPPATPLTVEREAQTLRFHWDWINQQGWVRDLAAELREVRNQLARATGVRMPRRIGLCPSLLGIDPGADTGRLAYGDDGEPVGVYCGTPLYAPLNGDTPVTCRGCGREWPREEWLRLGRLLTSGDAPRLSA